MNKEQIIKELTEISKEIVRLLPKIQDADGSITNAQGYIYDPTTLCRIINLNDRLKYLYNQHKALIE